MIIEENSMKNKRIAIIGNQWITRYLINKLITYNIKPYLIISSAEKNSKQTSSDCFLKTALRGRGAIQQHWTEKARKRARPESGVSD